MLQKEARKGISGHPAKGKSKGKKSEQRIQKISEKLPPERNATLSHEMVVRPKPGKIAILKRPRQPFRTKWTLDVKNWGKTHEMDVGRQKLRKKLQLWGIPRNLYARNGRWTSKTEKKIATLSCPLQHEMVGRQKLRKIAILHVPLHTKWTLDVKN